MERPHRTTRRGPHGIRGFPDQHNARRALTKNLEGSRILRWDLAVAWSAFFALLLTYWLTVAPEYHSGTVRGMCRRRLCFGVGHPPGNPTWMLRRADVHSVCTGGRTLRGSGGEPFVGTLHGLLPAFFLSRTVFNTALWVLRRARRRAPDIVKKLGRGGADGLAHVRLVRLRMVFGGGGRGLRHVDIHDLPLRLADSAVGYDARRSAGLAATRAYSLYVRTQLRSASAQSALHSGTGHDFSPYAAEYGVPAKVILIFLLSLAAVGFILVGVMPWSIALAAWLELMAVNGAGLPALSGVVLFIAVPGAMLIASLRVTARSSRTRRLNLALWMLAMLLTGYSSSRSDSCAGRDSLAGQRLAARQSFLVRGVSGPRAVRQQTASIRPHALQQGDV